MKNFKKHLIFLCVIIVLVIFAYYFYPKSVSLNSVLLKYCNKQNINEIIIRSTNYDLEKAIEYKNTHIDYDSKKYIKNNDEIDAVLLNFSNIKLIEHYGSTLNHTKGSYYFYIYENDDNNLDVSILGKEYIQITDFKNNLEKNYKIVDNSLDMNYLRKLISE